MTIRLAALLALLAAAPVHAAPCRQALAIGLDVSGSVDTQEFRLQVEGLAAALTSPRVRAALLDAPETPVSLAVFDWSGAEHQRLIMGWTDIRNEEALDAVASAIATAVRIERSPATGVGAAMLYGETLLRSRPECWQAVLDLTGDGLNNSGIAPRDVRFADGRPITVNALVIGVRRAGGWDAGEPGIAELTAWFLAEVVRGPDAFVETALGFEEFQAAMERKLLRELSVPVIGSLDGAGDRG